MYQRRSPGRCPVVSTNRGERLRTWFRRRHDRKIQFGIEIYPVTYADSRAGWSAVQIHLHLVFWTITFPVIKWHNGPPDSTRYITWAEQIRATHGPSLDEQERREQEEEDDRRARMALFDKQLKEWDARHPPEETDAG